MSIEIGRVSGLLKDIEFKNKVLNPEPKDGKFADIIEKAVGSVNNNIMDGEKAINNYISGKETSLHSTLITMEKADVSFKLMMEIRSKLMSSYQEIMRTQA